MPASPSGQPGGFFCVTPLKENVLYRVVKARPVYQQWNILSDQLIRLTSPQARQQCPCWLRRVRVWDAENPREIVLLTNHREFGATTVGRLTLQNSLNAL
jgi:hypothetical protein